MFEFKDIAKIEGKDIDLILAKKAEAIPAKGYLPCYIFNICPHGTVIEAGEISLRIGYNENIHYSGNIGYFVKEDFRGNHFAAKGCLLLKKLAQEHDLAELIITCDPDNYASRKTCEYVGAELQEIMDLPEWTEMYQHGKRVKCRYKWDIT